MNLKKLEGRDHFTYPIILKWVCMQDKWKCWNL